MRARGRHDIVDGVAALRAVIALLLLGSPLGARAELADPDLDIARRHVAEGTRLYEQGDYLHALAEFRLARAIKARPELDFDIARCHDRLEQVEEAIVSYERFVAATSDQANAASVRERIRVLSTRVGHAAPTDRPSSRARRYGLAIGVGVTAVVSAIVAAGLVGSVAGPYHDLETGACAMGCDASLYSGLAARAHAGYGLFGVAGALALVDIAAIVLAARSAR